MTNLGPNFYPKLVKITSELGMKPEDLVAIMISESGLNPAAHEPKYNGGGIIGFMPSTLSSMKYKGSPEDFRKLSGEEQLSYVKGVIQNSMKLNGGPFTSAAQYYVANFWPVALKLPGIRSGNLNTVFLEQNPESVTDPKTGKKYSKKYYDVGFHINPGSEKLAYEANPLFHTTVKGAITYGDMQKRVDMVKKLPAYQKALKAINDVRGSSGEGDNLNDMYKKYLEQNKNKETTQSPGNQMPINKILDSYLQQVTAAEKLNKKIYKKFLPTNNIVIRVSALDYTDAFEFSNVLSSALNEELHARAYVNGNDEEVEIDCAISGPEKECFNTVKQLAQSIASAFKHATVKIGAIDVKVDFFMNKKSSYQQREFEYVDMQHRKFLLKFLRK